MKQKKFLSMVLVLVMVFGLAGGIQTAWADASPTISTTSVLENGKADQVIDITLANDTFVSNFDSSGVYVSFLNLNPSYSANRIDDTHVRITIHAVLVKDEVDIMIWGSGLSSGNRSNFLKLNVPAGGLLAISPDNLPSVGAMEYFLLNFTATGGNGGKTLSLEYSTLPETFSLGNLVNNKGDIWGIFPEGSAGKEYSFTIKATDHDGAFVSREYTLKCNPLITTDDGFVFNGEAIVSYTGSGGNIVIPNTVNGSPVIRIGEKAFQYKTITGVTIPDGVTSIGDYAFASCGYLKRVRLPDTLQSIGRVAFLSCNSMENIVIPASVTNISDYAFAGENYTNPPHTNMTKALFLGNAPTLGKGVFNDTQAGFKIYYPNNATGYTNPWHNYPTEAYDPAATYTVTYDANESTEGSAPGAISGLKTTDNVTVLGNTGSLAKTGYGFYGWNTKADGTGTDYKAGDVLCVGTQSVTLYAKWQAVYSISIGTLTHGSITADKTTAAKGEVVTLTITPYEGWGLNPLSLKLIDTISGNEIEASISRMVNPPSGWTIDMPASNVMVTAEFAYVYGDLLFDSRTGTITGYLGNGGNVVIPSSINGVSVTSIGDYAFCSELTVCAGTAITGVRIPSSVTTINNGAFYGCNNLKSAFFEGNAPTLNEAQFPVFINVDGDFKVYYISGSTDFTSPTWNGYPSVAQYTVTFDKNDVDMDSNLITKTAISGGNVDALPTAPTRAGYTFSGWNTAANGSGTAFTASTVVTADITVYAQWTAVSSSSSNSNSNSSGSLPALSNDAALKNLAVSNGTPSPAFSATQQAYTVTVPTTVTSITVTPTPNDINAKVEMTSGVAVLANPIALAVGANTINVVVTAQDGTTKKTYTITVTRLETVQLPSDTTPLGNPAQADADALVKAGVITQTSGSAINLNGNATNSHAIAVIMKAAGIAPAKKIKLKFVGSVEEWEKGYIQAAVDKGYITVTRNTFTVSKTFLRWNLALVATKAFGYKTLATGLTVSDKNTIPTAARGYVSRIMSLKAMIALKGNKFSPSLSVTKGSLYTTVNKLLTLKKDAEKKKKN